ncbi:hypothetical protein [Vibrio jasicida]|uniref:hypothetical protein n=1 Tax=Vibrio jasicida TaxID=766224 RepID=UPI0011B07301|nr:hypothetical protein [Vibrio jasicida]
MYLLRDFLSDHKSKLMGGIWLLGFIAAWSILENTLDASWFEVPFIDEGEWTDFQYLMGGIAFFWGGVCIYLTEKLDELEGALWQAASEEIK